MSATGVIWDAAQGARSAVWSFQTSDEQRRDAPKLPPSLRVASKCGACGVALLAKGTTLGFVARLAVIRISRQRVSCGECHHTPGRGTRFFCLTLPQIPRYARNDGSSHCDFQQLPIGHL